MEENFREFSSYPLKVLFTLRNFVEGFCIVRHAIRKRFVL